VRRIQSNDLSALAGKSVSIGMPDGTVITGKVMGAEPDALLV
jgi:hypothetical protein